MRDSARGARSASAWSAWLAIVALAVPAASRRRRRSRTANLVVAVDGPPGAVADGDEPDHAADVRLQLRALPGGRRRRRDARTGGERRIGSSTPTSGQIYVTRQAERRLRPRGQPRCGRSSARCPGMRGVGHHLRERRAWTACWPRPGHDVTVRVYGAGSTATLAASPARIVGDAAACSGHRSLRRCNAAGPEPNIEVSVNDAGGAQGRGAARRCAAAGLDARLGLDGRELLPGPGRVRRGRARSAASAAARAWPTSATS